MGTIMMTGRTGYLVVDRALAQCEAYVASAESTQRCRVQTHLRLESSLTLAARGRDYHLYLAVCPDHAEGLRSLSGRSAQDLETAARAALTT